MLFRNPVSAACESEAVHEQTRAAILSDLARTCASAWDRSNDWQWSPPLTEADRERTLRQAIKDQQGSANVYGSARFLVGGEP